MVGRPSRNSETGRETHSKFLKWSMTPPKVWNWSGDPLGGPELVEGLSQRSGSRQ